MMSNVAKMKRPEVFIELDRKRQLKYTLNSFAEMEEQYGSVDKALAAMEAGSIKAVRFMLWIGLTHDDTELTESQVGNMIDITDLQDISEKMNQVMTLDLPDRAESPNE